MPIIVRSVRGPRLVPFRYISKMSMEELIAYEEFLWKCHSNPKASLAITDQLNAIYREVEWRAQDTAFR